MPAPPPLDSLWAFHLIAETGSVSRAAAAMGVTQPAVSRRLRELEARLGSALVTRGTNALRLTEAGDRFAARLRLGFAEIQGAIREVQGNTAPLRIRAYTTWALRWLIPRLPDFRARHPGIEVEVTTSTAILDLAREGVDAAIRTGPCGKPPSAGARPLMEVRVAPFTPPAAMGRVTPPLLGSKVRPRDWAAWAMAARCPLTAQPLLFESTTLAIQSALLGMGTVICPLEFVTEEVREGRLAMGEPAVATGDRYWLVLPQGRPGPALAAFADWLAREDARDAGRE